MQVCYSSLFDGWVVCELRQIARRIVQVPISVPYKTEDEAIHVMHTCMKCAKSCTCCKLNRCERR